MKKIIICTIFLIIGFLSSAQTKLRSMSDGSKRIYYTTIAEAEDKLMDYYEERKANEDFYNDHHTSPFPYTMFQDLVIQDPRAFEYSFSRLISTSEKDPYTKYPLRIIYSQNKKLRIYTWDDSISSISDYYGVVSIADSDVFSYATRDLDVSNKGEKSEDLLDIASGTYRIDSIRDLNNETIYLIYKHSAHSSLFYHLSVYAVKLIGSRIVPLKIFDGEESLTFSYNPQNLYLPEIKYSNKELIIPETQKNKLNSFSGGLCTGRGLLYMWNGSFFHYSGITYKTNTGLTTSLWNFQSNVILIDTGKFRIRIDKMPNGSFRYVSWSHPKTCKDSPDIIISNGYEEVSADEGDGSTYSFKYIFSNHGYFYIVSWDSTDSALINPRLVVKHYNKVILDESPEKK